MNRRGFALIATLWVIAALTTAVGLSLVATRLGQQTTMNRIALTRGRWAAEACLAIAQARWVQSELADTATVDLGRQARCAWRVADPTAKLNFNTVDANVLRRLGASERFTEALVEQRRRMPFDDVGQVAALPGADPAVLSLSTVVGPGSVNLSAAPPTVLSAVLGPQSSEAVERLFMRRALGRPYASLDALAADLSPSARAALLAQYADLVRTTSFAPSQLVITTTGRVEGMAPQATIEVVVVPLAARLAVVQRRMR